MRRRRGGWEKGEEREGEKGGGGGEDKKNCAKSSITMQIRITSAQNYIHVLTHQHFPRHWIHQLPYLHVSPSRYVP